MKNYQIDLGVRSGFLYSSLLIFFLVVAFYYYGFIYITDTTPKKRKPPALKVSTFNVEHSHLQIWREFSGHLMPVNSVNVKSRVSGVITELLFKEGTLVKQGQPLFVIDPDLHKSSVNLAQAQLKKAEHHAERASTSLKRSKSLFEKDLISNSLYDSDLTAYQVAKAEVDQAKARLSQAKKNLDFAYINAPISGRIGRAELTVGNLIEKGPSSPILTNIVDNDAFYADFHVDENTYIQLMHDQLRLNSLPVKIVMLGYQKVSYSGEVVSFDNKLDIASGVIRVRAKFKNIDGRLTAGMHVTIALGLKKQDNIIIIPELSVGTNLDEKYVYVINEDGIARYRKIEIGGRHDKGRIVNSGLMVGERIIVGGLTRIRKNTKVIPNNKI
ncbi:MAG: efflux RND transporter periplasmic adaptor subunit [Cellvibrionales bacterium]|nr:efflux RND transporter periplasmic adaptor subunit [Cellvibrionales bacterium]